LRVPAGGARDDPGTEVPSTKGGAVVLDEASAGIVEVGVTLVVVAGEDERAHPVKTALTAISASKRFN
jgi:hypothetical protein